MCMIVFFPMKSSAASSVNKFCWSHAKESVPPTVTVTKCLQARRINTRRVCPMLTCNIGLSHLLGRWLGHTCSKRVSILVTWQFVHKPHWSSNEAVSLSVVDDRFDIVDDHVGVEIMTVVLQVLDVHLEAMSLYGAFWAGAVQLLGISFLERTGILVWPASLPGQLRRRSLPIDFLELSGISPQLVSDPLLTYFGFHL